VLSRYQIPNVHPAFLAPVTYHGQEDVTVDPPDTDPYTVRADVWSWKFTAETDYAFTINGTDGQVELLQWTVHLGENFTNVYLNMTIPTDIDQFDAQFHIPAICPPDPIPCDNAFKQGLLSEKSYNLLKKRKQVAVRKATAAKMLLQ
jgi:hypothetical protein